LGGAQQVQTLDDAAAFRIPREMAEAYRLVAADDPDPLRRLRPL